MVNISYVVHSDNNENNVKCEFFGRGCKQEAIAYAKRWAASDPDDYIWVDKVLRDKETEEMVEVDDCIWSTDELEDEDDYEDDRSELPWDYSKHFEQNILNGRKLKLKC